MEYLCPVLQGVLPPYGREILRASACCILCQYIKTPRFPGIHTAVNYPEDRTGAGHVPGAMEDHRLEDNEPLCIP